jgi:hypothetical protein
MDPDVLTAAVANRQREVRAVRRESRIAVKTRRQREARDPSAPVNPREHHTPSTGALAVYQGAGRRGSGLDSAVSQRDRFTDE